MELFVDLTVVEVSYTATELTHHATTNFETIQKFLPVGIQMEKTQDGWQVTVMP